ncbi:hypothetical protein CIRG_05685 [Coccidioides immitis RMSCC 2394]|uniref:Uncharacterized protein n=1 Tax=Coccidioides immitis RMSCC 2394 TaxID=404692 RepID=A0A0J6YG46_COCIT|nr:hypothetical protein CIRG_05685 [Coccidioides immitis RMSCC 2394]
MAALRGTKSYPAPLRSFLAGPVINRKIKSGIWSASGLNLIGRFRIKLIRLPYSGPRRLKGRRENSERRSGTVLPESFMHWLVSLEEMHEKNHSWSCGQIQVVGGKCFRRLNVGEVGSRRETQLGVHDPSTRTLAWMPFERALPRTHRLGKCKREVGRDGTPGLDGSTISPNAKAQRFIAVQQLERRGLEEEPVSQPITGGGSAP